MPTYFLKTTSVFLIGSLAACASTEITSETVAGMYGCDLCMLSGSTLYLRPDGTFSRCMFSDTPEFDGRFAKETHGSYSLDGQRVTLIDDLTGATIETYVIRVHNAYYMVTEDNYRQFGSDNDVIKDIGDKRRLPTADKPYVCLDSEDNLS